MTIRILRYLGFSLGCLGMILACAFDDTLREYLDVHFWLPFSKNASYFERKNVRRISAPFAGMDTAPGNTALTRLRVAYRQIFADTIEPFDSASLQKALAAARANLSLTGREREEVDLIDAKIDMRFGEPGDAEPIDPDALHSAQKKLETFLKTARTPEFLSEARGWLAHIYYLLGDQTDAGKIYLDELNRNGSNLSRETILNSLKMTYGYDGGPELLAHLEDYFDTPEHAAFAIQLLTNPHWQRLDQFGDSRAVPEDNSQVYARIRSLLAAHGELFGAAGNDSLAILSMRTALRMGDPPAALHIAAELPPSAAIRADPDFEWMLASAQYLSRNYAAAEHPLLRLFDSPRASANQKAAAAYGLCGVYQKKNNPVEQIRFALWLQAMVRKNDLFLTYPGDIRDQSVYWAVSGWDLNLLLDTEAPIDALESFVKKYPNVPDVRLVQYSVAVRLSRENRYDEAAAIYESIHAVRRAPRLRQLAVLYKKANSADLSVLASQDAKYNLAEFLAANPDRIYFNDALWHGFQSYALTASTDGRLTQAEHNALIAGERKLKDEQEERWRAYVILRDVVRTSGKTELGRKAAWLALDCLVRISDRFGRQSDIRAAEVDLVRWLRS